MEYYYLNIRNRSLLIINGNKTTAKPFIFIFFFFSSLILVSLFCSSSTPTAGSDNTCSSPHTNLQPIANCATWKLPALEAVGDHEDHEFRLGRRELRGLGSSPPRCSSKCGKCTPCKAVHVPVRPGTPVTAEYYPEAWRCKCGNKIYMP